LKIATLSTWILSITTEGGKNHTPAQDGRDTPRQGVVYGTREKWEHMVNRCLERLGHEARIDHRRPEVQGIDRKPTNHVGPISTDFEWEGIKTERSSINREPKERNRRRELEKKRSAARLGTTLYDRAAMASMQRDAMRHPKDAHQREQRDGDGLRPAHPDEHRLPQERATREQQQADSLEGQEPGRTNGRR
jgi:hypothetical protein